MSLRLGCRIVVLENRTNDVIEIKVDHDGYYTDASIRVSSGGTEEYPAAKFIRESRTSLTPLTLKVYKGGKCTGRTLRPRDFTSYVKIIFSDLPDGRLRICGIEEQATDLGRFSLLAPFNDASYSSL
ncbi:uncharacterized protein LOC131152380 isoform X1 [Malania oleifera]|uniref:uncharacterized protein LOC131152380 isoform X1 n=1 Tax=Malania oleifera TaxID=397392 RepID=UPI0025AD9F28|nr:uncharacterized protein LOC131152380 isoform X1 [Malania oleifera]